MNESLLVRRIEEYASCRNVIVGDRLGVGNDGTVYDGEDQATSSMCAMKAYWSEKPYLQEKAVYLRLAERGVTEIRGCAVPRIIGFDDALHVLEMTLVTRPFVLDFAKSSLDTDPGFSDEALATWQKEKAEDFGSRWPEVQAILAVLQVHGIYMYDANPDNIKLPD